MRRIRVCALIRRVFCEVDLCDYCRCSRCKGTKGKNAVVGPRYSRCEYSFFLHLRIKIYNRNWNKIINTTYCIRIDDLKRKKTCISDIKYTIIFIILEENFTPLIYQVLEIKFSFIICHHWEFGLIWLYEPRDFTVISTISLPPINLSRVLAEHTFLSVQNSVRRSTVRANIATI